jgi:hypothetical protein
MSAKCRFRHNAAFPGCGAARSGAPLIRGLRNLVALRSEFAPIPGLRRTIPLRSMLRRARETQYSVGKP